MERASQGKIMFRWSIRSIIEEPPSRGLRDPRLGSFQKLRPI